MGHDDREGAAGPLRRLRRHHAHHQWAVRALRARQERAHVEGQAAESAIRQEAAAMILESKRLGLMTDIEVDAEVALMLAVASLAAKNDPALMKELEAMMELLKEVGADARGIYFSLVKRECCAGQALCVLYDLQALAKKKKAAVEAQKNEEYVIREG
jgi:hypothetical protein